MKSASTEYESVSNEERQRTALLMDPGQSDYYDVDYAALVRAAQLTGADRDTDSSGAMNVVHIKDAISKAPGVSTLRVNGTCRPVRGGVRLLEVIGAGRWRVRSARSVNRTIYHELRHAHQGEAATRSAKADYEKALRAGRFGRYLVSFCGGLVLSAANKLAMSPVGIRTRLLELWSHIPGATEIFTNNVRTAVFGAVAIGLATLARPIGRKAESIAVYLASDLMHTLSPYEHDARVAEKLAKRNPVVTRK